MPPTFKQAKQRKEIRYKVLLTLAQHKVWRKGFGCNKPRFYEIVRELVKEGIITRVGKNTYRINGRRLK